MTDVKANMTDEKANNAKVSTAAITSGYYLFERLTPYPPEETSSVGLDYQYDLLHDQILYLDTEQRRLSVYEYTHKYENRLDVLSVTDNSTQGFIVSDGYLYGSQVYAAKDDPKRLVLDDLVIGDISAAPYRSYWRLVLPTSDSLTQAHTRQQQGYNEYSRHKQTLIGQINACLAESYWGHSQYLQPLSKLANSDVEQTKSSFAMDLPLEKIDIDSPYSRVSSRSKQYFMEPQAFQQFFSRTNDNYLMLMAKTSPGGAKSNTRTITVSLDDVGIQIHEIAAEKDAIDWRVWQPNVVANPIQILIEDEHNLVYISPYVDEIILTRRDFDEIAKVHVLMITAVRLSLDNQQDVCKRLALMNSLRPAQPNLNVSQLLALAAADFNQRYGALLQPTLDHALMADHFANATGQQQQRGMIHGLASVFADLSYRVYPHAAAPALATHLAEIVDFNHTYSADNIITTEYQHPSGTITLMTTPQKGRTTLYFAIEHQGKSYVFERYFYLDDYRTQLQIALMIKAVLAADWPAALAPTAQHILK
ncbi:hypothetical protein [Shewanella sp. NIFS-20-20]|uniref:hypothetical protein n=1 Tax=Shewanella sp. NIFS-20-20 TaxID=2853806 RepID=UPI001C448738|nr:hypothetical protein [Shewanella sp. NIFS-20-20]MBV7316555.1 hypothetical protein [Shewanella sp. NIFS-20-20]